MKGCEAGKKKNGGFTLIEMLAVTVMLAILLAVGVVHVVRNARLLKITELDNMAREIYLAAENRAVLLEKSGRLSDVVEREAVKDETTGTSEVLMPGVSGNKLYIAYAPDAKISEDLLPKGAVAPALLNGSFYVVYETDTGNVADVFYAEKAEDMEYAVANSFSGDSGFKSFYVNWKNAAPDEIGREKRAEKQTKVGYYGSEVTPVSDSGTVATPLPAPVITIKNGEELILEVKYQSTGSDGRELKTTLTYDGVTVPLQLSDAVQTQSGLDKVCTWTLDTVSPNNLDKRQFKDWFTELPEGGLGRDFTVNAVLEQEGALSAVAEPKKENSLFGTASGDGGIAYIYNLRHLQNLDYTFSGVMGKTEAHQRDTIDFHNSIFATKEEGTISSYAFRPIENGYLTLYKSYISGNDYFSIKNLEVTADSLKYMGVSGNEIVPMLKYGAGLFSYAQDMRIENVCMVNAAIDGYESVEYAAGALVGLALGEVSLHNCRVYWEDTDALKRADGSISYMISGIYAGGLIGSIMMNEADSGMTTITDSFAATTIYGDMIGGLIGRSFAVDVNVENSYADCYLYGFGYDIEETEIVYYPGIAAGGLAGYLIGGNFTTRNVYAAGFIENAYWGGGLYGTKSDYQSPTDSAFYVPTASVSANNAYSTVYYQPSVTYATGLGTGVKHNGCYFLKYASYAQWYSDSGTGQTEKTYAEMIASDFVTLINGDGAFDTEKKTVSTNDVNQKSNPYKLTNETLGLENYDFPGLVGLPHYGDWEVEEKKDFGDFTVIGPKLNDTVSFDDTTRVLMIKDGAIVNIRHKEGTTKPTTNRIEVADGANANIILDNVSIDQSSSNNAAFKIADNSTGNVTITLIGTNILYSGGVCAGLQKNGVGNGDGTEVGKLTIRGGGSLEARGGSDGSEYGGAGIGGANCEGCSNIYITGGKVTATGQGGAAGIGSGTNPSPYSGSYIYISGGEVIATGGNKGGAGIGGSEYDDKGHNIYISGGTVKANGGPGAAGIGGGLHGEGSSIYITGGEVTANGGFGSSLTDSGAYVYWAGAGIGGGYKGSGSNIVISGGTVTANGAAAEYEAGAGIGGGSQGSGSNITISGGTVTANGGSGLWDGGAGIGGGYKGNGSDITISNGTVTANGGRGDRGSGAGIGGGGSGGAGSIITISVGTVVTAKGGAGSNGGADIGNGGGSSKPTP